MRVCVRAYVGEWVSGREGEWCTQKRGIPPPPPHTHLHLAPLERLGGGAYHPLLPGRYRLPKVMLRFFRVEAARVKRRLVGYPGARQQQRLVTTKTEQNGVTTLVLCFLFRYAGTAVGGLREGWYSYTAQPVQTSGAHRYIFLFYFEPIDEFLSSTFSLSKISYLVLRSTKYVVTGTAKSTWS